MSRSYKETAPAHELPTSSTETARKGTHKPFSTYYTEHHLWEVALATLATKPGVKIARDGGTIYQPFTSNHDGLLMSDDICFQSCTGNGDVLTVGLVKEPGKPAAVLIDGEALLNREQTMSLAAALLSASVTLDEVNSRHE